MKTIALTLAASLIASTSAFAGGLFDVNEEPSNYNNQQVQVLDSEPTASIATAPGAIKIQSNGFRSLEDRHPGLFDVNH